MDINRKNFEAYLLDYEEGNLSLDERKQVQAFMYDNQDLAPTVDFLDEFFSLDKEQGAISKNELLKDINQKALTKKNVEEFIIADLEGDLSRQKSEILELFLEDHPTLRKDYILYSKSFLKPASGIFYPNKKELTRGNVKLLLKRIYPWMALASSVLLLVGFYFISSRYLMDEDVKNNVAINDVTHPAHVNPVTKIPVDNAKDNTHEDETTVPVTKKEKSTDPNPANDTPKTKSSAEKERIDSSTKKTMESTIKKPIPSFEFYVIAQDVPKGELHPVNKYYMNSTRVNAPATDYKTIPRYLLTKMNDFLFPDSNEHLIGENSSNGILWALADVGVKGVNKITDKDITLNRDTNPEGKITRFSLESEKFEIARVKNH